MRVLLVNPPYPISETPSPPLSLAVLGAALEKAGAHVEVLDLAVVPYREAGLEALLSRFSPRVAGVTCVTMNFHAAARIVRAIRRLAPEVLTVMGGPHVSFCAEETLGRLSELDCICRGEGENSLAALCRAVADGTDFSTVPGLVWRRAGSLVKNGPFGSPVDLDALAPPARHLLPMGRYRALGLTPSMITSRGCPYGCIFCVGRKMGGAQVRYRNPDRVADEMSNLAGLGFHQVNVADDLFTADADRCLRVCRSIERRGISIPWTCFSRVDTISESLASALAGAGCRTVSFGVESADPGILKTVRKNIRPEQVLDAVSLCVDAGITPQISFILGLPGETRQTVEKTVAFAGRLQQMGATFGFHLLAPFPGTEVRLRAAQYGLRILSDDWRTYHANRAVVETASVTAAELDRIVIAWEKKFDEYLGHLGRLRQTGAATADEVWPLTRLEHTVVLYDLMMSRAVEERGAWRNGGGPVTPEAALEALARRIEVPAGANYDRAQLEKTLRFALSEGYLEMSSKAGMIRWKWVERLPNRPSVKVAARTP
jgi:radical SAM superfamily enzyme YgiQ (UPF0313 family)